MDALTAAQAASLLGISDRQIRSLIADGIIASEKTGSGEWLIDPQTIADYRARRRSSGRPWSPEFSWALVAVLAGEHLPPIDGPTTRSRLRQRIKVSDASALVRLTAGRSETHRFISDDLKSLSGELTLTGRSAAHEVDESLRNTEGHVEGYVRADDLTEVVDRHFLIAAQSGVNAVIRIAPAFVPQQVLTLRSTRAFDLALSTSSREHGIALDVVEEMRWRWLEEQSR